MHIKLHGLSHDGRAVGRGEDGKVVFVSGGLPGQVVEVIVEKGKKNFAEGRVTKVLEQGPDERLAPCSHAGDCGGCPWQALQYPAQLRWKQQLIIDALERIGKCGLEDVELREIIPSPQEWHCRNKMEFAFDHQARLGLRRRDSHDIVEVSTCLMQNELSMRVLEKARAMAAPGKDWRFLVLRSPLAGGFLAELISGPAEAARELGQALMEIPGVTGFVHSLRKSPDMVAYGEKQLLRLGAELEEILEVNGRSLKFSLGRDAFFQVNSLAAQKLYEVAADLAQAGPNDELWDVYCGVGGLALAAGSRAARVLGLESSASAVALARRNAVANGMAHMEFIVASGEYLGKFFKQRGSPQVLLADPPRAGLAEAAVNAILKAKPERLLLVSCNPATLARDVAALKPGYALQTLHAVDLFPQTEHVECVALLQRR